MIAQLGVGTTGNGGGGDDGDSNRSGNLADDSNDHNTIGKGGTKKSDFILVNPRNIIINVFTGRSLHSNPFLPFNNSIRRLILAQGSDGEMLLKMFDKVEIMGITEHTNEQLQDVASIYPKASEFDLAIKSAFLNWTSGVANNVIKYGVCNGFDAWRKRYNKYVPLAEDLQNIIIQELLILKPVSETEIDTIFNEIEGIIDLYVKAGPVDDLSDKWIRAAVLKHILEKKIATTLAL